MECEGKSNTVSKAFSRSLGLRNVTFYISGEYMDILAYTELNAFAFVVLTFIFINIHNSQQYLFEQKLFLVILALNAALLILDTLQWLLNGRPGTSLRFASIFIAVIYSASTPVPCFFWSIYADYQVYQNEKHIKKYSYQ